MEQQKERRMVSILALAGGFIALLNTLYYMEQLSYTVGVYDGIATTVQSYNLTASAQLLGLISGKTTLTLALYITYLMLALSLFVFAIGVSWFASKSYSRLEGASLLLASLIYAATMVLLQFSFSFTSRFSGFYLGYIGSALVFLTAAYALTRFDRPTASKRAHPISINPDTPYTNMAIISTRLMGKMQGDIRILDPHFDKRASDNLLRMLGKNAGRFTSINILTKIDRLGRDFSKGYPDFKEELQGSGITIEIRVMDPSKASEQHERLIMDGSLAYKIPPLNIINVKSEHIVGINYNEASARFESLWSISTKYENVKGKSGGMSMPPQKQDLPD